LSDLQLITVPFFQRDTLIRYLLDELHTYETDYSDALAPVLCNANDSLMGEAALIQPVSAEELRSVHTSVTTDVRGLKAGMDTLTSAVRELSTVITNASRTVTAGHAAATHPLTSSSSMTGPLMIKIPPRNPNNPRAAASAISHPRPASRALIPRSLSLNNAGSGTLPPGVPGHRMAPTRRSSHRIPKAGLVIPDVPVLCSTDSTRRPRKESWRDIVQHWMMGDPTHGLHTPLKDWPPEWVQGCNRVFATKYFERSVIALEFIDV